MEKNYLKKTTLSQMNKIKSLKKDDSTKTQVNPSLRTTKKVKSPTSSQNIRSKSRLDCSSEPSKTGYFNPTTSTRLKARILEKDNIRPSTCPSNLRQNVEPKVTRLHTNSPMSPESSKRTTSQESDLSESMIQLSNLESSSNFKSLLKLKSEPNLHLRRTKTYEGACNRSKSIMTTVSVGRGQRGHVEIPEEIKAAMVEDAKHHAQFKKKMSLLKSRFEHVVKSELVDFVAPNDDGLLLEGHQSQDYINTLMGLVEKDKNIAKMAVNLVSQIDVMESAEINLSKVRGGKLDDETFREIWKSHKKSRNEISKHLEAERAQLFHTNEESSQNENKGESPINEEPPLNCDAVKSKIEMEVTEGLEKQSLETFIEESIVKMKNSSLSDNVEEEDRETEIRRGFDKILHRFGCDPSELGGFSQEETVRFIHDKMMDLKKELALLKNEAKK